MDGYDDQILAQRLRFIMEGRGITITEAAEGIGVPYRTLQNQLGGKNRMPASTFAKMLELLEVPVSFVVRERIQLNVRAAQEAIRDVFGAHLPFVDENLAIHPAPRPETRTTDELEHQLKMLTYLLRDRYENRVYQELDLPVVTR